MARVGGRFAAQVSGFSDRAKARATAIFRESAQRLIEQANTPIAAGGKTPLDTGFLIASGQASLTGMPYGPSIRGVDPMGQYDFTFVLAGAKLGGTIYWGWGALYAPFMEYRYGFMRSAAQNWQQIVNQVAREAR